MHKLTDHNVLLNIQIKAALRAIRNMDNLPVPRVPVTHNVQDDNIIMPEYRDKSINDILDWLASIFGFQVISISSDLLFLIVHMFSL